MYIPDSGFIAERISANPGPYFFRETPAPARLIHSRAQPTTPINPRSLGRKALFSVGRVERRRHAGERYRFSR